MPEEPEFSRGDALTHAAALYFHNELPKQSALAEHLRNIMGTELDATMFGIEVAPEVDYACADASNHPWDFADEWAHAASYFCRHSNQMQDVMQKVMPCIHAKIGQTRNPSVACIGMNTGEEVLHFCAAYILLLEQARIDVATHLPEMHGIDPEPAYAIEAVRRIHRASPLARNAPHAKTDPEYDANVDLLLAALNRHKASIPQHCHVHLKKMQDRLLFLQLGSCDIIFCNAMLTTALETKANTEVFADKVVLLQPDAFVIGTSQGHELWKCLAERDRRIENGSIKLAEAPHTIAIPPCYADGWDAQ